MREVQLLRKCILKKYSLRIPALWHQGFRRCQWCYSSKPNVGQLGFVCLNTCRTPHLEMRPKCFTMATTELLSASKQIHCTLVACNSDWVTNFIQHVLIIHQSSYSPVNQLLCCWCHMKLLPSWCKSCLHHTTMHQFMASLHSKPHM